jgi:sigma-B regulation protein RsbU (phosphoserine phosphatase)
LSAIFIREVNPARMKMALNLVQFRGDRVQLSSAGMPPAFFYRAASGEVEEELVSGLPLGAMGKVDYAPRELPFAPGDVLLLISDGLPELRDREGRSLGYEALPATLAEVGAGSAEEILENLKRLAEEWSRDGSQDDDITIVVVRRTPETDSRG